MPAGDPQGQNLVDDMAALLEPIYGQGMIWLEWLPPSPDIAIGVYTEPGMAPVRTQTGPAAPILRPQLKIIVRGEPNQSQQPADLCQGIHDYIGSITNQAVGGNFYLSFVPMHGPEMAGRDSHLRMLWELNFSVMSRRLAPDA